MVTSAEKFDAYIAKWGHEPVWRGRVGEDGTKGATPFDLLRRVDDTGESLPCALFREYAGEFKGRRQLVWSPGLRDLLE